MVTGYSWHLLGGLSQTITLLNNGKFRIETSWYLSVAPGHRLLLPKDTTLRSLHLSLIDHAKMESIRWIEDAQLIESYQSKLNKFGDLAEKFVGSEEDILIVNDLLECVASSLDKMTRFKKGEKIPIRLGGVSKTIDRYITRLEDYLDSDKDD